MNNLKVNSVLIAVFVFMTTGVAFAGNNNGNTIASGNTSNSDNIIGHNTVASNYGNNANNQTAINSGNQITGPSDNGNTSTVGGNNQKLYANTWPSVTPAEGTSSGTASSIFGSLGIADTEKYKKVQVILQTLAAEVTAGLITQTQAQNMAMGLNVKLMGTVKTQRVLGILWETSGKNLGNLLGLLTFDSVWKDGPKQGGILDTGAQTKAATVALDNTEAKSAVVAGNQGNVGH